MPEGRARHRAPQQLRSATQARPVAVEAEGSCEGPLRLKLRRRLVLLVAALLLLLVPPLLLTL